MDADFIVDGSTVTAAGEIDMSCTNEFAAALTKATEHAAGGDVTINMADVSFLDSTGLRHLLNARSSVSSITVVDPSSAVIRLLQITATATLFGLE